MESTFRLIRVRGIEIGANWSYVFIFGIITVSLANGFFPSAYPGMSDGAYWAMGVVTSVAFVVCLLLHELGHAFRALKEGMEIEGITLWLLGGVAKFKGMFPSAGAEFRIAIAGPAVTFVLILVFGALRWAGQNLAAPDAVLGVVDYLFQINLTLLVFNMVPALPLDGGRVLRSTLWARKENFLAATVSAARIAKLFAGVIIALGALLFLTGAANGAFLALVGWFILQAGQAEVAYAMFRQTLTGITVRDVMSPDPVTVDPAMTLDRFIDEVAYLRGHSNYPVVDVMGRLVGLVSLRLAAAVPVDARSVRTVADVMVAREAFGVVGPDDEISQVVTAMQEGPGRAVVADPSGRVLGIISMADVARAIELQQLRNPPVQQRKPRRLGTVLLVLVGLAAIGYLYSPPFVTFAPGTAFDVTKDIKITGLPDGAKEDQVDGKYILTSVAVQQPNVFGAIAALAQGKELAPLSDLVPADIDPDEYFRQQEIVFKEAQTTAAAAAAKAAGMKVEIEGKGALIEQVSDGSPAAEVLQARDVVTEIDGKPVRLADDLSSTIRARPVGTRFEFVVQRGRRTRTVEIESKSGIIRGAPGIGVVVSTKDYKVDLPFKISFREREIGGPSAGLAYALAVYDLIEPSDLGDGRSIATTGTIDIDGTVGPIGGVGEKTVAARRAGAELFLVPELEVRDVPKTSVRVVGVSTLQEAIDALRG